MPALIEETPKQRPAGRGRGVVPDAAAKGVGRGSPPVTSPATPASPVKVPPPKISVNTSAIIKANSAKMERSREEGKYELIVPVGEKVGELIFPDFDEDNDNAVADYIIERPKKPDDHKGMEKCRKECASYLSRELDKIDLVGDDKLDTFGKDLGVKFGPTLSNSNKRVALKKELVNKAAGQLGIASSLFSDLITYKSSKDHYLPLLPRDMATIEEGLDIIQHRQKFLKADLLAYTEINDIETDPKASADDLRAIVIKHYIKHSERSLTVEEEKKYQEAYEDLIKRYVKE